MISFIRGTIHEIGLSWVDVDVSGVGYRIYVTGSYAASLTKNESVFVYTHQVVREDAILLYGFPTEIDRHWFEWLTGVSGVGPKGALQILDGMPGVQLAEAIVSEDVQTLCTLQGVGKKTAQRLIVELKDKIRDIPASPFGNAIAQSTSRSTGNTLERDVLEALSTLGYSDKQTIDVVQGLLSEMPGVTLEDAIRQSLQRLSRLTLNR